MKRNKWIFPMIVVALMLILSVTSIFANAVILVSAISGAVSEADLNQLATFDVTLEDDPGTDVTLTIGTEDMANDGVTPQCVVSTDGVTFSNTVDITFNSGNHTTPQTISVSANDDGDIENAHYCDVKLTVTSTGSSYDGQEAIAKIDITDNDAATSNALLVVYPFEMTLNESENKPFLVSLSGPSAPANDVTVNLAVADAAQCGLDLTTLTFTSGDWTTPQEVTYIPVDDAVVEGDHTCDVTLSTSSDDAAFSGLNASFSPTIEDNDTPSYTAGATVTPTTVSITEGGATADFSVVLDTEPSDTVVFDLAGDAQCSTSTAQLTFTTGNWNAAQTVTVTATDDGDVEGNHTCTVTIATNGSTAATEYSSYDPADVTGNITDNDTPTYTAGATVDPTSVAIAEGGATADFSVVLDTEPSDTVIFDLAGDTQCSTSTAQLTFTTGDWNSAQTVTVTATDDSAIEGNHTCAIAITTSGSTSAAEYGSYDPADVTANITDNDSYTAGAIVNPTSVGLAEGGSTADFSVVLDSAPSDTVVFDVIGDAQCSTSTSQLTFTTGNWNAAQTITVTAIDDGDVEGNHTCTVTLSTNGSTAAAEYGSYDPADVTGNITDNDTPTYTAGATVSPTTVGLSEGGATADFTVELDSAPSDTVVFDIIGDAQCSTSTSQLTFTTGNWNAAQIVTVTAIDDGDVEGNHTCTVTLSTNGSTAAAEYGSYDPDDVTGNISDNDSAPVYTPSVSVVPTSITVVEGGATADFSVVLDSEPSDTVVIDLTGDAQCAVSTSQLTFTTGNWNASQTVTASANDDANAEGQHNCTISLSINGATAASEYAGYDPTDVTGTINDNDSPGLSVLPTTVNISEDGTTASFGVNLATQPTSNVAVSITSNDTSQCVVSSTSLVFSSSNWQSAQNITVSAIDDSTDEADRHTCSISLNSSSSDGNYNGLTASVTASIADNDSSGPVVQPRIIITETDSSTWVSEAGGTDTFYLSLSTMPTSNVELLISTDSQCTVNDTQKTLTQTSWNAMKSVQVSAVNDGTNEADTHTCTIHITTIDAYTASEYRNKDATLTVNVSDNDSANPAVLINPSSMVMNEGDTGYFKVTLQSQPSANVLIEAFSSDRNVCTVSPSEFTLTSSSWNTGKNFAVTGAYNNSSANLACNITLRATSADGSYHGINTPTFTTVINNTYAQLPSPTPYPVYPTYTARPTYVWASSTPWATSTSIVMPTATPLFVTATNTPDPDAPLVTNTPTPVVTPTPSGPSAGVIAIIVISTLVLFGAVGVGAYFIIQKYF